MFSPRFYWRYYFGFAALLALVALGLAALSSRGVEQSARTELARSLELQASLLREVAAPVVAEGHRFPTRRDSLYSHLQERLQALGSERPARFTVILADGRVIADSDRIPRELDNHATRPEILQARAQGIGRSERFSVSVQTELLYVALRIGDSAENPVAYARASYPTSAVRRDLHPLRTAVLRSALVAIALALLVGWMLTRRLTRPLRSIAIAVNAIRAGNYRQRVLVEDRGAVGELARAFNAMEDQIAAHLDTIEQERAKIHGILEALSDAVVAVDADRRVVHLNRAAATTFGLDPQGALGQRLWELVRSPEIQGLLERTLAEAQGQFLEARIHAGDSERTFDLRTTVLHDRHGKVEGAVLVLQDVSQLRRLEGMRRDFVSNVSHELKTPLTALRGLIESIMDDEAMDRGTMASFLDRMHVQTTRLNALISDLLHMSQIEQTELPLDLHAVDLVRAARVSISQLQESIENQGISISTEFDDEEILVEADEETLRQIYDNLLTNAIRYTPEGGRIRVRLHRHADSGQAVLEVEDTGVGIESRHHQRIFERFFRVDKARSREAGGTGLGLSIVKHVVSRLGGHIQLESSPGQGSCFRVTFRLSPTTRST